MWDSNREKKLSQRTRLAKALGLQMGTLYARHRLKIAKSAGYMTKGNVRHYVACNRKRPIDIKGNRGLDE